jgi:hypothetical protein
MERTLLPTTVLVIALAVGDVGVANSYQRSIVNGFEGRTGTAGIVVH